MHTYAPFQLCRSAEPAFPRANRAGIVGLSSPEVMRKIGKKPEFFAILSASLQKKVRPVYRLGNFTLEPQTQLLVAQDKPVPLSRKPYQVLLYLIENRHRMVPRAELLEQFWAGKDVYDQTLSKAVGAIRKALGEPREDGTFIETRWAAGYRYIGPFEESKTVDGAEPLSEKRRAVDEVLVESSVTEPRGLATFRGSQLVANLSKSAQGWGLHWALLFATLLAVFGWTTWGRKYLASSGTATNAVSRDSRSQVRPSVAVLVFKNLSERADEEWFGTALAEMLSTELGADGRLRTIPGETIARATKELSLSKQLGFAPETLSAVRRNLGADYVLTGSYTVVDSGRESSSHQLRLDICLQNTKSGETVTTLANTAGVQQLFAVVATTGAQMIAALRLPGITPGTEELARAALPSNPAATQLYMQGLEKLRQQDLQRARDILEQAVVADPTFPLAHLALADAWQNLGYLQNEKTEATKAFELSTHLSRELQLYVQARHLYTIRDWDKTIETYRTLVNCYPDNIEYGLQLAGAQSAAGKPREAQATIELLRKIPLPSAEDPRLDMEEAFAARSLSEFQVSARAASRAAEKARAQGAPLLYARALSLKASAIAELDSRDAARLSEEARAICQQFQDLGCLASAYRRLGNLKVDSDPEGAEVNLREALRLARHLGNRVEENNDLNSIGVLLSNRGRLKEAIEVYAKLLDDGRDDHSLWGTQLVLNNLGGLQIRQGKLSEALANEEKALGIARQIGLKVGAGDELLDIAQILEFQGDLTGAETRDVEALALFEEIKSTEGRAVAHAALGNICRYRGNLSAARDHYRQAIDLLAARDESSELAAARLAMARLNHDEGRNSEAVSLSISSAETFHKLGRPAEEASARAFLANVHEERGDAEAAKQQVGESRQLIQGSESVLNQLEVGIALARVNVLIANSSNPFEVSAAVTRLRDLSVRAKRAGTISLQLQADLASLEVQMHVGHPPATQTSLDNLERNAKRNGFLLISRQASALRSSSSAHLPQNVGQ